MLRKTGRVLVLILSCCVHSVLAEEVTHAVALYGDPK